MSEKESKELVKANPAVKGSIYSSIQAFEDGQRIAKALSSANMVPAAYKNNIPNTMLALEIANRINVSPFMVMQNLDIIQGKPSWSSAFIIAALNSCGRFNPLRWEMQGNNPQDPGYAVRAYAKNLEDGDVLYGPWITWEMVKAEGWLDKKGSKWKTMPELMFRYRSSAFFGRLYAPDILKGMHSVEEMKDIRGDFAKANAEVLRDELIELYNTDGVVFASEEDRMDIERIIDQEEAGNYPKAIEYLKSRLPKDAS